MKSQREYQAAAKAWRKSEKAKGNNVMGNSRPRVSQYQLAYEVNVENPLTEEERAHQPEPETKPISRSQTRRPYKHNAWGEAD